jgi:hypothetical protein
VTIDPAPPRDHAARHATDEQIYVITAGSDHAIIERELIALRTGSALRVPAASGMSFKADDEGLEFLAFWHAHHGGSRRVRRCRVSEPRMMSTANGD